MVVFACWIVMEASISENLQPVSQILECLSFRVVEDLTSTYKSCRHHSTLQLINLACR